jgi:hypothetical protein
LAALLAFCVFAPAPALFLFVPIPARADDAMMAAASNFYALVTGKGFSSAGIPEPGARAQLAPLLTPRLAQALAGAASAQTRFLAKHKGAPPLLEGDIFSSLFEGPTAWKVGSCSGNASTARCSIAMTRQDPGKPAVTWTDTLVLANQGGWKVDDLVYDANFSLGNTGTLGQMLKMAQTEAP